MGSLVRFTEHGRVIKESLPALPRHYIAERVVLPATRNTEDMTLRSYPGIRHPSFSALVPLKFVATEHRAWIR